MKSLLFVLFSLSSAGKIPQMNFNAIDNSAAVCNTTDKEAPNPNLDAINLGSTPFLVLFHAVGCAGVQQGQMEICDDQIVPEGQCVFYHFKWGTTRRSAQICVPRGHGGARDEWNCGSANSHGHFSFHINNDQQADVHNLTFETPWIWIQRVHADYCVHKHDKPCKKSH